VEFNIEQRENGGGIAYHLDKKGEAIVIYNDPTGMLIKVKREGAGTLPIALTGYFTTFEKAKTEVERYLYESSPKRPPPNKKKTKGTK